MYKVTFLPFNRTVEAGHGDTLLDVALDHGVQITHDCGGNCACTTCRVQVISGADSLSTMEAVEADRLATFGEAAADTRLACQALVVGDGITVLMCDEDGR